ncbi:SpoIIE family protein phosphatase [Krasilnikoviella flava]|uniref:PAS fold-containing protein n=1 Tax=Krasilnikoviella flava TaxID=526729 RepID=A0A1T5LL67_9MICO|nr:SpoIIE family protein phosphatase [Krasilnikoviella flava]SKC76634.1 PAS fold-containing protein [Krasilnikoviella flava]
MGPGWFEEATARSAVGREARSVAWEATPLGRPDAWPVSLRHAVRLCFSTRFPVMMVWGPDLTLIYNDGYRDMLGTHKHPAALGAPAPVVWREIWHDVGPLFEHVLETGEPTWSEDLALLMNRSSFDEETYFTFSYSPLLDDDGAVAGVLDIATETTHEVVNQRRLMMLGELQATLPTAYVDLSSFAGPVIDVLSRSKDLMRAAVYDVESPPGIVRETGTARDEGELALVQRALASGQREVADGVVVKPVRDAGQPGHLAVVVLRATRSRPWDPDYARFLSVVASTTAATLRDVVHRQRTDEALRRRAARSEEESARAREVSMALQRAVLTEPPDLDGLEVVVHYQPAAAERDIGGDWYDAFVTRDGATAVVIGDVVGHDLDAAVAMGQLRALVRAIGYDSQATPARVLERVDGAVDGLGLAGPLTATALVARIEADGGPGGRARTVRWSSAGHLPPILVRGDGTAEILSVRNDLLLGLNPTTVRTDHTVQVAPGDTLLLYTDGLVERRSGGLRGRIDALARLLEGTQSLALEDVVESALTGMLTEAADDDVAVVAVRALAAAATVAGADPESIPAQADVPV